MNVTIEQALGVAQAELARVDTQLRELSDRRERLAAEVRGLELAVERHSHEEEERSDRADNVPAHARWATLPRTDAVERVLVRAGRPVSPTDIARFLQRVGRDDDERSVSATLAHLSRTDRAHAVRRGYWVSGPEPPARPSFLERAAQAAVAAAQDMELAQRHEGDSKTQTTNEEVKLA